jgi:hypothetical protein
VAEQRAMRVAALEAVGRVLGRFDAFRQDRPVDREDPAPLGLVLGPELPREVAGLVRDPVRREHLDVRDLHEQHREQRDEREPEPPDLAVHLSPSPWTATAARTVRPRA